MDKKSNSLNCLRGVLYKAENWHALSHEQYFSKHHFLDICQCVFNTIVTELFINGRKLNVCLVFITQSYFDVLKNIRLNSTSYFIKKIPSTRELQQIAFNHSSDADFKEFMNLYENVLQKMYYSCIR